MKKNLVIFYPSFEKGGVTKILINLIQSKFIKDYNLHVISTEFPFKKYSKKKNFFFYRIKNKKSSRFIPQRFLTAFHAMFLLNYVLKKFKKDILVHSMQSNIAAIIICMLRRKKIVIRNSENPIYSTIHSENIFSAIITFFLKLIFYNFSDGIITNSKGSAKSLRFFVFNKKKIFPIYNPYLNKINSKKFKKNDIILNIARLRKQKDHITLLNAFKIFLEKNKKFKLIILGHGNLRQKLELISRKLKIQDKVIFKGWVSDTSPYLKKAKIFVLSSIYEGLGNVLIDAINFDLPCISTNCPSGPSEILLDGKGGYLVEPKSANKLAEKMSHCNNNYKKSIKMKNLAKKKLSRFLVTRNTKNYFNHLNKFY